MACITRISMAIPVVAVMFLAYFVGEPETADAADTGFKAPTAIHQPAEWKIPTAAFVDDGFWTQGDGSDNLFTGDRQGYSGFNFTIPDGSVITGIEVSVDNVTACGNWYVVELSGDDGATFTPPKQLPRCATPTYGGPTDLWGYSWSPSSISNANFVVLFRVGFGTKAIIDFFRVKVYYRLDADGDGYQPPADCNDSNPATNPGAFEGQNFVDDDCDGFIDEGYLNCLGASLTRVDSGVFNGTPGDDVIWGSNGVDVINGLAGNDKICGLGANDNLLGGGGNDALEGGDGNDTLNGGPGSDFFEGQTGSDTVSYPGKFAVSVNLLTGVNNQGDTGWYLGVENLRGSNAADTLTGNGLANKLEGLKGNDTLNGGGGPDWLLGAEGVDTFNGGPGSDTCNGGPGADVAPPVACETVISIP